MSALGSVTVWLDRLRHGEHDALQALWSRYFTQLVAAARERLVGSPRALADEEDVAVSAFDSFFRRARQGQFPRLADRHDLWGVLLLIMHRKANDLIDHETRHRRDWRRLDDGHAADAGPHLLGLLSKEPDPSFALEMADRCAALLARLRDDQLRLIAVRKLEGNTNGEIAAELGCALATVERRLGLIRVCWWREGGGAG